MANELNVLRPVYCMHLRSKGMYITGEINPTYAEQGMGDGNCWCGKTQHVLGPDDQMVERDTCVPGRQCYQTIL